MSTTPADPDAAADGRGLARRLSLEAAADASVRVVDTDPAHNARERVEEREERER